MNSPSSIDFNEITSDKQDLRHQLTVSNTIPPHGFQQNEEKHNFEVEFTEQSYSSMMRSFRVIIY